MEDPFRRPVFGSAVIYDDRRAALDWLERAFGFTRQIVITDKDGAVVHAEMRFGNGYIMIGGPWNDDYRSPAALGSKNTQSIHVVIDSDIDAHCAHAEAAGAVIVQRPEDQFWGDRTYRARDHEGHVWTFAQTRRPVSREEAEQASGLKIDGWI